MAGTNSGDQDDADVARGFSAILMEVEGAAALGTAISKDGARLYGHLPHIGPQAWLHIIYLGLSSDELAQAERDVKRKLPRPYSALLRKTNGLTLFSGGLDLYGLKRIEPWTAHYDEYGRLIGRTDYNAGNAAQGIPDVDYHTYEYGPGYGNKGMETGSHIPGEYQP